MTCDTCGRDWPTDRYNPSCASPGTCFGCRASGIGFAYLKYPHGRKEFAGATIRERQDKEIAEAKSVGMEIVPKWHRTYTGPASSVATGGSALNG